MDKNTEYLLRRMDDGFQQMRIDLEQVRTELRDDIEELKIFRNRLLGMAALISFTVSGGTLLLGILTTKH